MGRLQKSLALTIWLLAIVLAACGGTSQSPQRPQVEIVLQDAPLELEGTEWILIALRGADLLAGTHITLGFDGEQVRGFAGCNAYGGRYAVTNDGSLTLSEVERTEQACLEPEGVMAQEADYFEALQSAAAYRASDSHLEIDDDAGNTVLFFTRKESYDMDPRDLERTVWQLVSLDDTEPVAGSSITLSIQDESHASGSAGCREYTAAYEANGDELHFSGLSMTGDDACLEQEALYRQEGRFTDALTWTTNYRLEEGRLELYTARGEILVFEPLKDRPEPGLEGAGPDFPPTDYGCESPFYMVWNSHRLEGLSEQLQQALDEAEIEGAMGHAEAFGEDWFQYDAASDGDPVLCNFSIMQTDFYVTVPAVSLADTEAVGSLILQVLSALEAFPPENTPGSQPGYIQVVLAAEDGEGRLWFSYSEAEAAKQSGLAGHALLVALHYKPSVPDPTAAPGTPSTSTLCDGYLDLKVSTDVWEEEAVVTSYRCNALTVDSTGQGPARPPTLVLPTGAPMHLRLAAETPPDRLDVRLYPDASASASFFRWPEELPLEIEPVDQVEPSPNSSFQYLPQVPPGEYALLIRATWQETIDVFYALSFTLQ